MSNLFDENWLNDYQNKRKCQGSTPLLKPKRPASRMKASDLNKQYESPHFKALQLLAKDPSKAKGNQEHYSQVRVLWHYESTNMEIYQRLHATPNGGLRHNATAGKMKAEGQKKGYPDLSLDKPRGLYCGMRIEMKYGKNGLSEEQIQWLRQLDADGYYCVVCYSDKEAIDAINHYWNLGDLDEMPAHINDSLWKKITDLPTSKKVKKHYSP